METLRRTPLKGKSRVKWTFTRNKNRLKWSRPAKNRGLFMSIQ